MKLAVIDHVGNFGGGSRVVRALLPALKNLRKELNITYFGNRESIVREGLREEFSPLGVKIKKLSSVVLANEGMLGIKESRKIFSMLQYKYAGKLGFMPPYLSGEIHKELEKKVRGFDLAFFTWPFLTRCPSLECPMVGIFHDFNFRYYFTGQTPIPPTYIIFNAGRCRSG